ncbi:hypothetical protein G5B30_08320 [Sphingobacterium sp. SGG-5]|uniref:hypothetical protein n=1 Tax=Sphingobacterium sp. SGG-5 TaxID=2710881 RepID=UPI0013EC8F51|nr:hypothetical protein [Sphingobacterium sp. SGG-5]NGM61919.1 hypothetical protein [Sphingobacterium sp. SGG-5]
MKDKELITVIAEKLKNSSGQTYREGAWEKFKAGNTPVRATTAAMRKMWYAAASVVFLIGLGAVWFTLKQAGDPAVDIVQQEAVVKPMESQAPRTMNGSDQARVSRGEKTTIDKIQSVEAAQSVLAYHHRPHRENLALLVSENHLQMSAEAHAPKMLPLPVPKLSVNDVTRMENVARLSRDAFDSHLASGTALAGTTLAMKEVDPQPQNKLVLLSKRLELGLFVSPYATEQKMNVGGGFLLGFKLSNRLTVRTGASYNTYEVNTLKNPLEENSTEMAVAETPAATESMRFTAASPQKVVIPNINAVKGFVRSVDIPLELKFRATRSFYAVAGMSYSSILDQERNAYYIENINQETFAKGYPETQEQVTNAVKPVTRSVESTEKNVNTNSFAGFVNFAIGREIKLNKNIGVSVEPYLKVPVGGYRRADMDYTNGGIRIMTTF